MVKEINEINDVSETWLAGLSLKTQTTNEGGKSMVDCGNLWQKFESERYSSRIPNKLNEQVYAVYYQYEGDYTQPFSYFIGCAIKPGSEVPDGFDSLTIPPGSYQKFTARGKMPDCMQDVWKRIWKSGIKRSYRVDFEIYDHRSKDWNNAEVDVFVSTNNPCG